jgi:hypothetical protein
VSLGASLSGLSMAGALCALLAGPTVVSQDQEPQVSVDPVHERLDRILDTYVRDGLVYYRALKSERKVLDNYVAALASPDIAAAFAGWPAAAQQAFWVNAYNALVLQSVVDAYPIKGTAAQYPASSIRQIGGAFDRRMHQAAGRRVTLDQIEREILPAFGDPRLHLALGRGALGGGRLRSEAYATARLDEQLGAMASECLTRRQCVQIDRVARLVRVTPVIGWHEAEFSRAYGSGSRYAKRSPIERAILNFLEPHLLPTEVGLLADARVAVRYLDFDWRLNDLTGGRADVEP